MKLLLLALLLPALAHAGRVTVHVCTNGYSIFNRPPVPDWVEIEGCDMNECSIQQGDTLNLRAAFAPSTTHYNLEFYVRVFFTLIQVPIDQPPGLDDACPLIIGGCPIRGGEGERVAEVDMLVDIPNVPVAVTVRAEVSLRDLDTGNTVVCGGVAISV
ncbi:uncharacterized protein LOC129798244 [Phlebotomus papatasi]|uniref:MD-2-related lipid-recognition domain-containing protein n=1 Tax=Phlebotomus papatasi TaxID=29031 RepID=A0A1B0DI23_PHLPP|nr:uncharacterized protein LOC129798244 [Phlebotomus papatasi]